MLADTYLTSFLAGTLPVLAGILFALLLVTLEARKEDKRMPIKKIVMELQDFDKTSLNQKEAEHLADLLRDEADYIDRLIYNKKIKQ